MARLITSAAVISCCFSQFRVVVTRLSSISPSSNLLILLLLSRYFSMTSTRSRWPEPLCLSVTGGPSPIGGARVVLGRVRARGGASFRSSAFSVCVVTHHINESNPDMSEYIIIFPTTVLASEPDRRRPMQLSRGWNEGRGGRGGWK